MHFFLTELDLPPLLLYFPPSLNIKKCQVRDEEKKVGSQTHLKGEQNINKISCHQSTVAQMAEWVAADTSFCRSNPANDPIVLA